MNNHEKPDLKNGVPLANIPDGGKLLGVVDGEEVLLVRRGIGLFAVGAYCTHYHGPLDLVGADGLVLFNRFYQPDIDLESLEIRPNILLSTPMAMRVPLRWIALLYGRLKSSLAATSGIHSHEDVIKLLMVGADATMLCSALLRNGIYHLKEVEAGLLAWMEDHEYESVKQMKGSMSQLRCADPSAFERAQYMRAIKAYQPL
jgi:dihydroorotate dehydrogenase (fumarate)